MPGDFFDTNVLVYIVSSRTPKADRAERLVRGHAKWAGDRPAAADRRSVRQNSCLSFSASARLISALRLSALRPAYAGGGARGRRAPRKLCLLSTPAGH